MSVWNWKLFNLFGSTNDPPLLCCRAVQGVQELQLDVRDCVGTGALSGQSTEALVGEAAQQVLAAVQRPGGPDGPVAKHEQIQAAREQRAESAAYCEYNLSYLLILHVSFGPIDPLLF